MINEVNMKMSESESPNVELLTVGEKPYKPPLLTHLGRIFEVTLKSGNTTDNNVHPTKGK